MFRVFKVTSPMNVGSWLLGAGGTGERGQRVARADGRRAAPVRAAAHAIAAALGPTQCTYTAALVSDTAIPVWHEARRELPFVFAASSAATAGAAAVAVLPPDEAAPARRLAVVGLRSPGSRRALACVPARNGRRGLRSRGGRAR